MKPTILLTFQLFYSLLLFAQDEVKFIELKNIPIPFIPRTFYIADVIDARSNRSMVGYTDVGLLNKRYRTDLKNGAEHSIEKFLSLNLSSDTSRIPVILKITELSISESRSFRTAETGSCRMVIEFESSIPGMPQAKIQEVTVNLSQSTSRDISSRHEALIRQALEDAFKELDKYINRNENHPALVRGVKVEVLEDIHSYGTDTVFYEQDHPLTYADFKGIPDHLSIASAATFSGFNFSASTDVRDHYLELTVHITPFFVSSASWMRKQGKNSDVLGHEQLHFDISRLSAITLKQDILSTNFQCSDYAQVLDTKVKQADKQMKEMQAQYDKESNHGLDKKVQQKWREKIRTALAAL